MSAACTLTNHRQPSSLALPAHTCHADALLTLQLLVVVTGEAMDKWEMTKAWFNWVEFPSVDALLAAWNAPGSSLRSSFKWDRPLDCE